MRTHFTSILGFLAFAVALFMGGVSLAYAQSATTTSGTNTPSIYAIIPTSGSVGTEVTIEGTGFTQGATNNITLGGMGVSYNVTPTNLAFFNHCMTTNSATTGNTSSFACSPYSQTLTFTVPNAIGPYCPPNTGTMCPMYMTRLITPGTYAVGVTNANGTSNTVNFSLTSASTTPTPVATSTPSIYAITPTSGPTGTTIIIKGSGFTDGATNDILVGSEGAAYNVTPTKLISVCPVNTSDANPPPCLPYSETLTFTLPSSIGAYCPPGKGLMCPMYLRMIGAGPVSVTVRNANGTSNAATFTVTASSTTPPIVPPIPIPAPICTFSHALFLGSTGDDVKCLQQWLAQDSSTYPGGYVTGYFGPLTLAAVERYQAVHSIVSSGDANTTGYGFVGPRTRAALFVNASATTQAN